MKTSITLSILALVAFILFIINAFAQTMQPSTQPVEPFPLLAKTEIRVRPVLATTVPLNEPVQIDLGNLNVPGVGSRLTRGVTVKAFTRYITFKGRKIAQVVLVGVEKNGRQEPLPAGIYTTQFDLPNPELDPKKDMLIRADGAAIIAALNRLVETAPADVPQTQQNTAKPARNSQPQNGGGASGNSQASSYKIPDAIRLTPEAKETVRVTTAGCPVRIDTGQMRAIQQSKTETSKGSAVVSESACSDSAQGFDIQKSYTVCSDQVDLTARTATAQYVLFYVDAGGSRQDVTQCSPDTEKVFPIVEKFNACTTFLDYTAMKAVPQSALIYQNDNNAEVQVRGCQASESKLAVAMIATTNGCSIRHDFTAGKSYQQGNQTYLLDGIQYTAGSCTDNGTAYVHAKVYDDSAGGSVCPPIVDLAGGQVTLQSRIQITVNGLGQYITDCTPDITGQLALVATTDGCTNAALWTHDLAAGQSYGQERYYYVRNGQPNYATGCQQSSTVYPHQVVITGWQDHDGQLFAYPLTTVYITPPQGRYDIQVSQVLAGATQMPYQLTGTATVSTNVVTYTGCDKFTATQKVEQWKRPDLTTYEKPIGPDLPIGPAYACTSSVSPMPWANAGGYHSTGRPAACGGNIGHTSGRNFTATQTLTREDGTVISTATGTKSIGAGYWICGSGGYPPYPGTNPGMSQSNTWNVEMGW